MARPFVAFVVVVATGCSGATTAPSSATPSATSTGVASDLAPSQIAASTVPEPPKPPPCDLADLDLWTAQVVVDDATADAVIRLRNNGEFWCEADIGRSPFIDQRMEPDVWLDPGETADLVAGQAGSECLAPALVSVIPVSVGGQHVAVPSAVVIECAWSLTAYYPNDATNETCEPGQLELVAVDSAVLVRNVSARPCVLDDVTAAIDDGRHDGVAPAATVDADVVEVRHMLPGDVAAFGRVVRESCGDPPRRVDLVGAATGDITVDGVSCRLGFQPGAGRPWYGTPDDHAAAVAEAGDMAAVLVALDPFDATDDS